MIYIIMGVSGSGKSSLGMFLSEKLGWPLHEGDDYHSQESIDKMASGEALSDQDRLPWLLELHELIQRELRAGRDALVTCSALKRLYRLVLLHGSKALPPPPPHPHQEVLGSASPDIFFVFLRGDHDLIRQRLLDRRGHYMKADMLQSQYGALECPVTGEENVLVLDVRRSTSDLALEVQNHVNHLKAVTLKN